MVSKAFILMAAIAYVEARFGQEQEPIAAISSVQGGDAGAAATIAGAAISDLLGGANSCAKLVRADQIFTELGGGADALAAAIGMVTAEKNTNPFANGNVQNVCGDPALPVTPELRGITPLIDPAVDVNGDAAALSQSSAASPLAADGLSVFDLMDQAGLGDLVQSQANAGGAGGAAAGNGQNAGNGNANAGNGNANAGNGNANAGNGNANAGNNNNAGNGNANAGNGNANAGNGNANAGNNNNNAGNGNAGNGNANAGNGNADNAGNAGNNNNNAGNNNNNAGNNNNNAGNGNAGNNNNAGNGNAGNDNAGNGNANAGGAAAGGADFGLCTPTITFQGGENGRPADEFTFQIADPLARGGQGEALNPDIITNALCNQLTNVCEANDAAVATCEAAQAAVKGGPRDKSTADKFNELVGFAGAVTNPDGGPADVAAAKRVMRRGLRM